MHGWVTAGGNWSNANRSNLPTAYWIVPNTLQLDQAVIKFEREVDWVQTDHIDWGFRSVNLYGIDYRYTTAGGWFSQQLLYHNNLYGYDPVELYGELYIPRIFEGMVIRVGAGSPARTSKRSTPRTTTWRLTRSSSPTTLTPRRASCSASSSTNETWCKGQSMRAPTWPPGIRVPFRPASSAGDGYPESNNDAFYTCLNNINNANFRYFMADGHKVGTRQFQLHRDHLDTRFSQKIHTKTEAYYMWQFDAVLGGTPSLGAADVVRWRRRSRQVHPGHVPDLRRAELHVVPALQARLLHGPQRVVARSSKASGQASRATTPATRSA